MFNRLASGPPRHPGVVLGWMVQVEQMAALGRMDLIFCQERRVGNDLEVGVALSRGSTQSGNSFCRPNQRTNRIAGRSYSKEN